MRNHKTEKGQPGLETANTYKEETFKIKQETYGQWHKKNGET